MPAQREDGGVANVGHQGRIWYSVPSAESASWWASSAEETGAELIAKFDAMAERVRAKARGDGSIEGGAGRQGWVAPKPTQSLPSDLDSQTPPRTRRRPNVEPKERCVETIPTKGTTPAHQCTRRARFGKFCRQHFRPAEAQDFDSFPAALEDQPDGFPFPEGRPDAP